MANVLRVKGDLRAADRAFSRALRLWAADAGSLLPFDETRLLDLEGSLRRGQRRFDEALALLDRALEKAPSGAAAARLLLNKSATLEQKGDVLGAVLVLEGAAARVGDTAEPRLLWGILFNRIACLCHLGRVEEAARLLPQVREQAAALNNRFDLVRTRWLLGRVALGRGRRDEAREAFEQVRADFVAGGMAYDAAIVNLDLALLLLEEGRTPDVQELARQVLALCRAGGVGREALAALDLFARARDHDELSAMARRLVRYLEQARHAPGLRFANG
ncbi:MAG TPA: tetratricopeptide repeat protein [Thermoanaerobaculia bacterium]|nr:tetratricopeptide repeat protein [Thermoanaerobaculia bacterium]